MKLSENQKKVLLRSCDKIRQLVANINVPTIMQCILHRGGSISMQTKFDTLVGDYYTEIEVQKTRYLENEIHIFKKTGIFASASAKEITLEDVLHSINHSLWRAMGEKYGYRWEWDKNGDRIPNYPHNSCDGATTTVFDCGDLRDELLHSRFA